MAAFLVYEVQLLAQVAHAVVAPSRAAHAALADQGAQRNSRGGRVS